MSKEQTIVHAACPHDCPDTCAMLVTVENGEVTKVRGDPDHPFTQGGLCVKVSDYERHAYHPDRLLYPMRRVGPKGEGRFERIEWADAISEICDRFTTLSDEFGAEAIVPYSYLGNMGILNGLNVMDPFMHRLGASVTERTFCSSCRSSAYLMTLGPAFIDPESLAHSRYIVIWGGNVVSSNLHLWPFIREAQRQGAKIVVIDPYRSKTAARADWFVRIRPGTDAALALGMMNVIISEGLTDDDYIARHTTGFDELAERAAAFPPERVEELTGVPADDVRLLAREFAASQPSAIRVGVAVENHPQGGQAFRAIFSLPALVGAWRHVGGGVLEMPLWAFPVQWDALSQTQLIRPGTRVVNSLQLAAALTGELGLDPPVKALMVCNANPVVIIPEQDKLLRGLARDDLFTVVSDHFVTDTARYADLVLPATTALEHFDIMFSWGHTYVTVNNQAIAPVGEAIPNIELFRRLAEQMGFTDEWFKLSDEQVALASLDWSAPVMEGITLERLKRDGWAKLNIPSPDEFAPFADGNFPTPSGKVEFHSSMAEDGDFVIPVFRQGYTEFQGGQWVDPVPNYVPPTDEGGGYPLCMVTPKAHAFLNSQYGNMDRQRDFEKDQDVLIHTDDARARDITAGQSVRVFNEHGGFLAVARVSDDVVPGAVIAKYGHWMADVPGHSTPAAALAAQFTDIGRGTCYSHIFVDVVPV
jgi:anaerobic selenocysteine-containing dehydrogenase